MSQDEHHYPQTTEGHEFMKGRHMHQPPGGSTSSFSFPDASSSKIATSAISLPIVQPVCDEPEKTMFTSTIGTFLTCLGSAAGTGNVWRFPRILASESGSKGSLDFYLIWTILLFMWSIPLILLEYAVGRFTLNSVPAAFYKFLGPKFVWVGGWMVIVIFCISAYYPVVLGWCIYYLYSSITLPSLPATEAESEKMFTDFTGTAYLSILCQVLGCLATAGFLFGGIRWIERANMILVPVLLAIIIFTFCWAITLPYAEIGVAFLLTPTWSNMLRPGAWVAAAGQNAFDTGAGQSVLMTYAAFMTRESSIVKLSVLIPLVNNLVSFYASIALFSTAFATIIADEPTITRSAIIQIMRHQGPGGTGLAFTWMPVLFAKVGVLGRILCTLFFFCLTIAGISSLLALLQGVIYSLQDFGLQRKYAVLASVLACIALGLPSAVSTTILDNQDRTWGNALIVSGLLLTVLPLVFGPFKFRNVLINDFGNNDWKAPWIWVPLVTVIVPLEGLTMIGFWLSSEFQKEDWYQVKPNSLMTVFIEWFIALFLLIGINMVVFLLRGRIYDDSKLTGNDPYHPESRLNESAIELQNVTITGADYSEYIQQSFHSNGTRAHNSINVFDALSADE